VRAKSPKNLEISERENKMKTKNILNRLSKTILSKMEKPSMRRPVNLLSAVLMLIVLAGSVTAPNRLTRISQRQ
jgi:hypothetical protein